MSAVRVEDVVGEAEQLVEPQRIPGRKELGDTGRLRRRSLRRLVAHATRLGAWKTRVRSGAHVFVTEIAREPQVTCVLVVVERDGLPHRWTLPQAFSDRDGDQKRATEQEKDSRLAQPRQDAPEASR